MEMISEPSHKLVWINIEKMADIFQNFYYFFVNCSVELWFQPSYYAKFGVFQLNQP